MSGSILIAQITDCHLSADPQMKYRGIDAHQNLKALLYNIKRLKPDLLLASGDLSEDGSRASYEALKGYLDPLDIPVLALPGNHDDFELLSGVFPGSPIDRVAVSEHGPWQILRLNSSLPGRPEGRLQEETLVELENILTSQPRRPHLIALHHQPIPVGSPWIDKYCLFDAEAFLQIVDRYANVKAVVWGHVHQAFETDRNGTAMLGGPSSAINGRPGAQKFSADPGGPACRWLKLSCEATLLTGVLRSGRD